MILCRWGNIMNKKNLIVMKIKMFITSYFPLYIILLALQIKNYQITCNIKNVLFSPTIFVVVLCVLSAISVESTIDLITTRGNERYKYDSIERTGDAVISYMMTYIVPLLSETFFSYKGFIINITLFLLIGIMYVKLDLVYFNPTWILFNYIVYTSDSGDLIISNIPYGKLKQNSGRSLKCSYLVKGIYLIRGKDNLDIA